MSTPQISAREAARQLAQLADRHPDATIPRDQFDAWLAARAAEARPSVTTFDRTALLSALGAFAICLLGLSAWLMAASPRPATTIVHYEVTSEDLPPTVIVRTRADARAPEPRESMMVRIL
ncbi:MAG: hypothetical protein SFX74_05830 [Fimbriimonadaceae bacterium]|nr:hypothetical protein [Fimbriimonadaceae bacterium]